MRTITISAEVDVEDVFEELSDEEFGREYRMRGLGNNDAPSAIEAVAQAIGALRLGRPVDAQTILERHFFPAHKSIDACRERYRAAMAGRVME